MSRLLNSLFTGNHREKLFIVPHVSKIEPFWIPECGITYADPRYHEINIEAEFGCLMYIISGKGIITHNEKIYVVQPGDTYLFKQGEDYCFYSDCIEPMENIWFKFEGSLAGYLISSYHLDKTALFRNVDTSEFIYRIHEETQSGNDPESIKDNISITFMKIMQHLHTSKVSPNIESMPLAKSVKLFIDCHLLSNLTIDYIAKFYNKTSRYVITTFRRKYKITPYQYFIQEKVKLSEAIIRSTHQPYRILLEMLHISEDDTFKEHFTDTYGLPPTEYHEQKVQEAIDKMTVDNPQFAVY